MSRRRFLRAGIAAGAGAFAAPLLTFGRCRLLAAGPVEVSTRAVDLVLASTVIDMLGLLTLDWGRLARWQAHPESFEEPDYRVLERAKIDIFHPAVETGARDRRGAALRWAEAWRALLGDERCFLARVESVDDLFEVPRRGRLGVVFGFQNSDHFESAADVAAFCALGQRVSQLTYNERNRLGSGCYEARDRGLTRFGAEVVAEMNRAGMAVDLSHCGERTTLDAIAASRAPVLVTHANCRALVPAQPRCKSDAVIRALAKKGGVMGITMVRAFVGAGAPTLADLLDHFEHVARVAGPEHVGLGSDLDTDARDPATGRVRSFYAIRGLDPLARVYQVADGLLRRGWSADAVQGVLGLNFLRALGAIWPAGNLAQAEGGTRRDPFCPAPHPLPPGG